MPATVCLAYCRDYLRESVSASLREAVAPLGGLEAFIQPGQRVALKPNLLCAASAEECVDTHPEFVAAAALLVREVGGEPFLADSPAFGTLAQVAEAAGLGEVVRELDLPLVPLRRPTVRALETARGRSRRKIAREIADADVVLNLPKLKAHRQLGLTAGLKNCYGCLPGKRKIVGHFRGGPHDLNFAKMIVEHYLAVSPALTLVDGILAMEGVGPRKGTPRPLGLIAAAVDAVALDAVLCDLLQAPPSHRLLLEAARELGVGETDRDAVSLVGADPAQFDTRDWSWPPLIGTQFGIPRVVKSWLRNLWVSRLGLARTAAH